MAVDLRLPNAQALGALLVSAEIPAPEEGFVEADLDAAIQAAYDLAQELTGWVPLLSVERSIEIQPATPAGLRPGEWPYTPGAAIRLPAPVLVATSLSTGDAAMASASWKLAGRAGLDGPYTLLRLYARPYGDLALAGTIGRYQELPKAIAQAILRLAGSWFLSQRREGLLAEGLSSWDEAGTKETRGYEMTTSIGAGWQAEAETTLARFARVQF